MTDAAPAAHRWGLREAVFGFAVGTVLAAVASAVVASVVGGSTTAPRLVTLPVIAGDLIGLWVGLVGAVVIASRRQGSGNLARDFGLRLGRWWDLPLGAAVGLGCQYALVPLLYLPFEQADPSLARRLSVPAQSDTGSAHTVVAVVVLLALLAVGAPLVEELFFRGLLLRGLAGRLPAPVSVVISGLLFAGAHFESLQFAGLAAFGIVLGVLTWRTGRLGPAVAAHAVFNGVAVLTVVHLS